MWLLVTYPGVFTIADDLSEVKFRPFGTDSPEVERAARVIRALENAELADELKEAIEEATKKSEELWIDNVFLSVILKRDYPDAKFKLIIEGPELLKVREIIRKEIERIFGKYEKYVEFTTAVGILVAKDRLKEAGERKDLMVIRAVSIAEDLTKIINMLVSHVREWYGHHFPELGKLVDDHELYLKLIVELGKRENFTEENLKKYLKNEKLIKQIVEAKDESVGIDITETDIEMIKHFARRILQLYEDKRRVMEYLDEIMQEIAPNLRALVGSVIAAKLIRKAGGLGELAKLPASTIQILGAEKALFRALAGKGTPPKHGIIFQDPRIFKAPWWQRGKIARALAGKLAIAAKVDYFSGEYIGDELLKELERRIDEIKRKYPKPPARPKAKKPKGVPRKGRPKAKKKRGRR